MAQGTITDALTVSCRDEGMNTTKSNSILGVSAKPILTLLLSPAIITDQRQTVCGKEKINK